MVSKRLVASALTALALLFVPFASATRGAEGEECYKCSMPLARYAHSRMASADDRGNRKAFCSLACAVSTVDPEGVPTPSLKVADYDTHGPIDARGAVWVVGGSVPGVMTPRAKWAFEARARAEKFVAEHGGEVGDWRFALAVEREDARKMAEEAKSFFSK